MTQHQEGGESLGGEWPAEMQSPFYSALDAFDIANERLLDHTAQVALTPPEATWAEITDDSVGIVAAYHELLDRAETEFGELDSLDAKEVIAPITLAFLNRTERTLRQLTGCKDFSALSYKQRKLPAYIAQFDEYMEVTGNKYGEHASYQEKLARSFSEKVELLFTHFESHLTNGGQDRNTGSLIILERKPDANDITIKDTDQRVVRFAFAIKPPIKIHDKHLTKDLGITHSTKTATYGAMAVRGTLDAETGELDLETVFRKVGSMLRSVIDPLGEENVSVVRRESATDDAALSNEE